MGRGEKCLLRDAGSELQLGGREKSRAEETPVDGTEQENENGGTRVPCLATILGIHFREGTPIVRNSARVDEGRQMRKSSSDQKREARTVVRIACGSTIARIVASTIMRIEAQPL